MISAAFCLAPIDMKEFEAIYAAIRWRDAYLQLRRCRWFCTLIKLHYNDRYNGHYAVSSGDFIWDYVIAYFWDASQYAFLSWYDLSYIICWFTCFARLMSFIYCSHLELVSSHMSFAADLIYLYILLISPRCASFSDIVIARFYAGFRLASSLNATDTCKTLKRVMISSAFHCFLTSFTYFS